MGVLALLGALLMAGCGGHVLPEIQGGDRFATARMLYERGSYGDAATLLKSIIDTGAGSARIDEAIYLLGQTYLKQREWQLAAEQFERVTRDYPESDSTASASFRLGEAYFGQARRPDFDQEYTLRALSQWTAYQRANPDHWLQGEANRRIMEARVRLATKLIHTANLYRKLRHYEPSRIYYRRVIDEYGDTSLRPQAELGLAMVDARNGKKTEAVAALREIERQYPQLPVAQEAARERRRIER